MALLLRKRCFYIKFFGYEPARWVLLLVPFLGNLPSQLTNFSLCSLLHIFRIYFLSLELLLLMINNMESNMEFLFSLFQNHLPERL
jgi:hypothetical protein